MQLNGVPETYRHYTKLAVPMAAPRTWRGDLKLYHLEKPGEPVPQSLATRARNWLAAQAAFEPGDCGFVVLHRCGADFHFLLPVVWRGANEAWEIVAYHHGDMTGFARFNSAYPAPAGEAAPPRPTFCAWELVDRRPLGPQLEPLPCQRSGRRRARGVARRHARR